MADKKEKVEQPTGPQQFEIQTGNIEVLQLKLLNDISNNLTRIANALEQSNVKVN